MLGAHRAAAGEAANVAYLVRKLGVVARLFAHTGDDGSSSPARHGVDLSGVKMVAGMDTGTAMVFLVNSHYLTLVRTC